MVFPIKHKQTPGGRTLPGVVFVLMIVVSITAYLPAYAQTISPLPSPIPTNPVTPSPVVTTMPTPTGTDSPSPTVDLSPIPGQSQTSAPLTAPSTTPTAVPSPTITIQNANVMNQASNSSSSSAVLNIITVVNTTATGSTPQILNYTDNTTGPIDLSIPTSCNATASAQLQSANNTASIHNVIDVSSATGNATANPAQATANVFNMANTTISGSCWNFQVVNFFAPHTGDVTLPSYQPFVQPKASTMTPVSVMTADVINTASVTNTLTSLANTGIVNAPAIQTGDAVSRIQSQEVLNTTILGNNWLFLTIRSYGGWSGTLLNWPGAFIQTPTLTYAYLPISPPTVPAGGTSVVNKADITNTITALADTGNTDLYPRQTTGPAISTINLFDFLNTTISGDNWYFAYITIFDTFHGNFIFPEVTATIEPVSITPTAASTVNQTAETAISSILTDTPTTTPQPTQVIYFKPAIARSHEAIQFKSSMKKPSVPMKTSNAGVPENDKPVESAGFLLSTAALLTTIIKKYVSLRENTI